MKRLAVDRQPSVGKAARAERLSLHAEIEVSHPWLIALDRRPTEDSHAFKRLRPRRDGPVQLHDHHLAGDSFLIGAFGFRHG